MKFLKIVISVICAVLIAVGAVACGDSGHHKEGVAEQGIKKTALKLWLPPFRGEGENSPDRAFWENRLKPWADKQGIDLSLEITPWGTYEEKYLTGFSSGRGPDVGYVYLEMLNDFIEMGAPEILDSYLTEEDRAAYLYLDRGFIKGHQYTIPFVVGNGRVCFFNKRILARAGVTALPQTWEDFVAVTKKIKAAKLEGVLPMAGEWADPAIGALNNLFYPYFWQAGGELYNADGSRLTLTDNGAALEAARFIHDLRFVHGVLPEECLGMSAADVVALFNAGKVGTAVLGANYAKAFDASGLDWDYVASLENKRRATFVSLDSLVINAASQHKQEAFALLRELTSPANMESFHSEISPFPPIRRDEKYLDNERFKPMYEKTEELHTLYVAKGSFKLMDRLHRNLQLMMLGDLTPEEAIAQTAEYYEAALAE